LQQVQDQIAWSLGGVVTIRNMRVFARIVERRSFTQAADDLGLPRSSVTDAVKGLEARWGAVTAAHDTSGHPTLDGEAYYSAASV
jgi:DNA-binding transcriptional LysR family regulator